MNIEAEIRGLDSFKKAMAIGEAAAGEGMYIGTRRSLAAFRREFISKTPANIRGQKGGNPRRDPAPIAGLRSKFRWTVYPQNPVKSSFATDHVKSVEEVHGSFFAHSTAAHNLENPGTRRSKGAWMGIPIANSGNPNAQKLRGGEKKHRARKGWRTVREILKKRGYDFRFQAKMGHTILWAKKKRSSEPPFAVMLLVRQVQMDKQYLQFFELFEDFRPGIIERFDKGMKEAMRKVAKRARQRP